VTVTGDPFPTPAGVSVIAAVQVPQLVLNIWNVNTSGVVKLLELKEFNQKGTPETVYVTGTVPDAVTWIDRAWLSFRATVGELTSNCDCARAGAAIAIAAARRNAVFFTNW
jgi:hypothetical protein